MKLKWIKNVFKNLHIKVYKFLDKIILGIIIPTYNFKVNSIIHLK